MESSTLGSSMDLMIFRKSLAGTEHSIPESNRTDIDIFPL